MSTTVQYSYVIDFFVEFLSTRLASPNLSFSNLSSSLILFKITGIYRASPEKIAPFEAAINQYQDPARLALIKQVEGSSENEWDIWKASIEYGCRSNFEGILDFFVNLSYLQNKFTKKSVTEKWYWSEIEPVTLDSKFYYRPEIIQMLRYNAGSDAMINHGWLVTHVSGQIDAETIWSNDSYLVGTKGYFAYIQLYMETIQ